MTQKRSAGLWLAAAFVSASAGTHATPATAGLRWPTALPEAGRARASVQEVVVLAVPRSSRVRIPGGAFNMGSSPIEMQLAANACQNEILRDRCPQITHHFRAEGQLHEVEVSPYDLDRMEVTVEDYARCVSAGSCPEPGFSRMDARFARPRLPVTHVSFAAARGYCGFVGGRLPTEAEFELAARGPEGRRYPWGRLWNPHLSNHGAFAADSTDGRDGFIGLAEVGSFPDGATPQGILDLAGNVAEWVSDFYELTEEGYGYSGAKAIDPTGPKTGAHHVVRGGSYRDPPPFQRGASRMPSYLTESAEIGFRCAYSARK